MSSDRKLVISIAAALLVLFTAVAVVSTLGTGDSGKPTVEPARAIAPGSRPPTTPAEPVVAPASVITLDERPVSAGTLEEAELFEVEPGVNYLVRGIEAYQSREFGHAAAYLMAEADVRPDRAYTHYLLALALWKDGRLDEAAGAMSRSLELDDTSVKSFVNLARIQNDRGEFDAALEASTAAVDRAPDDAAAHFLTGRSLYNLGDLDAAAGSLRTSLEIDPENGFVWNMLGLTELDAGLFEDARGSLERAVERRPQVAYIHNNLGMALERSGLREEAVLAYRRAVSVDGAHARAAANLARIDPDGTLVFPVAPDEEGVEVAQQLEGEPGSDTEIP